MMDAASNLLSLLKSIVGNRYVITRKSMMLRFSKGFRYGEGKVLAVVQPATLLEQWKVLKACHEANVIIIMQAANTGLTGGSTPDGNDYDRDIVIINTLRIQTIQVINEGRQVICFGGATLDKLEKVLEPYEREPHSVIGSSCLGASVLGGVCNNSGGALVRRGPAYTQMSLFAQINSEGNLVLVNHLGIRLGKTPEEILLKLQEGDFTKADIESGTACSDSLYEQYVRDIDADTPARFNADSRLLYEASGCAGKLAVFAVRLDTFPIEKNTKVFYIGTNNPNELTDIRRHILLEFKQLPICAEYMDHTAFDVAEKYGKDTFLAIHFLGTKYLPALFTLKSRADGFFERLKVFPTGMSDWIMQGLSYLFPNHLPGRLKEYRNRFKHYLLLKVSEQDASETRDFLSHFFDKASGDYFECTPIEVKKAFLHRFVTAGAATRMKALYPKRYSGLVALDIALKRNETHWVEALPYEIEQAFAVKLYYGHFLCHVFHQDYLIKPGYDPVAIEHKMWGTLDKRGAEYPAEHNVGHLYYAKPNLAAFYREIDPCNCFNPGIGKASKLRNLAPCSKHS